MKNVFVVRHIINVSVGQIINVSVCENLFLRTVVLPTYGTFSTNIWLQAFGLPPQRAILIVWKNPVLVVYHDSSN